MSSKLRSTGAEIETVPSILSRVVYDGTTFSSCGSFRVISILGLTVLSRLKPRMLLLLRSLGMIAMNWVCRR